MSLLIVQKKLNYPPETLGCQAGSFISEVRRLALEAGIKSRDLNLELADIGFTPKKEYIELKLYFRTPLGQDYEPADRP
ncbi:MAG: hypothetical protein KGZ32_04410 [Dethiobacter sp.]|jgi:hypothetical protein|nr:hypothetical protein [Dethiobacter sp.]